MSLGVAAWLWKNWHRPRGLGRRHTGWQSTLLETVAVPYRQQFSSKGLCFACGMARCLQQNPSLVVFSPLILRAAVGDCRQGSARPDGTLLVEDASCLMVGLRRPEDHIPSRGSATSSSCGSSSMFGGCILTESQKYSPQNRARTSLQRWRWCRAALVSGNPLAFAQGSSGLTPEGMRSNGRAALVAPGETRKLEPSLACILLPQSELEDEGIWSKSQTQSSVGVCWFDAGVADTRGQDPVSGRRLANPRQHRGADLHCCRSTAEPFWVPCIRRPSA